MVTEAQLRGIPVVSTSICGLGEANQVPQTQVPEIPLVFDPSPWGQDVEMACFFSDLVVWKLETLSVVTDLDLNCGVDQIHQYLPDVYLMFSH